MKRSSTDTLMSVMETFGQSEPNECIVVWTNEDGDICCSATTDSRSVKLGMLEMMKQLIVADMRRPL
ncbi:MAG TPA: hypothetical protein VFW25_02335 [Silvibacterium sp.]|nr:hypothetical protein [Silvibacterium sp.]